MNKVEAKAPEKSLKPNKADRKRPDMKKGLRFFKEVYYELKKVTWPSRKDLKTNTITVLVVTLVAAILIGLLDWGMSSLYGFVVK